MDAASAHHLGVLRNCIEVCPTGALSFTSEFDMRAAGTWEEESQTETTTVCAYCGVGCNLTPARAGE